LSTVLGTRIHALDPVPARAFVISDLHVPDHGGEPFALLQRALDACERERAALLVLGDLFDSYVSRAQVRVGVWRDVAAAFAAAAKHGVAIHVLHGNRDFLLGPEFERASGARVVAGGLRGLLAGRDTLLLHGDELCVADLPYQRAKRWLRHPVTRSVLRALPLRLALAAAARARRKSRMVIASGDQGRFLPTVAALDAVAASGARRVVFGHIHRSAHGHHGALEYRVLPAFDATGTGLSISADAVTAVAFGPGGAWTEVAQPGPCAWPAGTAAAPPAAPAPR
jgi:UDP-2,3-diacylglucosamine hydrolase